MIDRAERNSQSIQSILEKWEQFYYYLPTLLQYPAPQQYRELISNGVVTRYSGTYHRNDRRQLCPTHCHRRASPIRLISSGVTLSRSHSGRSIMPRAATIQNKPTEKNHIVLNAGDMVAISAASYPVCQTVYTI